MEWRNHNKPWPSQKFDYEQLDRAILKRANEGSGIYQMFSNLADVVILDRWEHNLFTI